MKVVTYMCENCFEPHIFNQNDNNSDFLCPKCGEKMMYFGTEDIDPTVNKVINRYDEEDRKLKNPGKPIKITPTVTCPYCQSTNTKKINIGGLHSPEFWLRNMDVAGKQFHCNHCGADF